ncbi:16S rRNA (guanine(966)-N(2))-methyltransferase RsmD [Candidatus Saccharibacteria bacterium]|nr:16S rRNA (guanine(966)-N(2))-methyltransferase RsmD [Candidatus Saccharibacteria bacterium]
MARLRIIAGEFGGRFISADTGRATHPMGDRPRSGFFNTLESRGVLTGAKVLDAFAGTGALGFEALSRGASSVDFIEQDKRAQKVIVDNITTLNVADRTKLFKTGVGNWTKTVENVKYDIIFADPPYHDPQFSTAFKLLNYLNPNGLMILSYMSRETAPNPNGVVVVDKRSYGEASLAIYQLDR